MATRTGRLTRLDRSGQYARQLGWKRNAQQQKVQHKFRLGSDRRTAESRDELLRKMWERIEAESDQQEPLWDEHTLEIAKAVARGVDRIPLPPMPEDEPPITYAKRLQAIQDRFPFLRFKPTEEQRYAQGIGERAHQRKDIVLKGEPEDLFKMLQEQQLLAPPLRPSDSAEVLWYDYESQLARPSSHLTHQTRDDGATLHQAMEGYINWIREHYFDLDLNDISEHAYTKIGQVQTLKSRHDDVPLTSTPTAPSARSTRQSRK